MSVIDKELWGQLFTKFTIKHYACNVEYSIEGFIAKNKNEVVDEIKSCAIRLMGADIAPELPRDAPQGMSSAADSKYRQAIKGPKTTVIQFRNELQSLITLLRSTQSHFVRCIKPNDSNQPGNDISIDIFQTPRCHVNVIFSAFHLLSSPATCSDADADADADACSFPPPPLTDYLSKYILHTFCLFHSLSISHHLKVSLSLSIYLSCSLSHSLTLSPPLS